jgi:hypothetical protein
LKVSILVGLEGITPRICVTGTFTHDVRSPPGANPGTPHTFGDGFETQYRQSLSCFANALPRQQKPPGLRRLRFSSFKPLVKERRI